MLQLRKLVLSGFCEISRVVKNVENLTSMKYTDIFSQRKRMMSENGEVFSHSEGNAREEVKSALWIRVNPIWQLKEDEAKVTGMSF